MLAPWEARGREDPREAYKKENREAVGGKEYSVMKRMRTGKRRERKKEHQSHEEKNNNVAEEGKYKSFEAAFKRKHGFKKKKSNRKLDINKPVS